MGSLHQVLVTNNSTASGSATAFVTAFSTNSVNDLSVAGVQEAGFKFTIAGANISVTDVGFVRATGTSDDKVISIRNNSGTLIASGTAVYTSAAVGSVCWASVGTPVTLTASTVYHITTHMGGYNSIRGQSAFYAHTTTGVATINDLTNGSQTNGDSVSGHVNFKYTT